MTIIGLAFTGTLTATGVRAPLTCIGNTRVRVADHAGDVQLWEAELGEVDGLVGGLTQRLASSAAGHWGEGHIGRGPAPVVSVSGLDGPCDMEIGRAHVVLANPTGTLRIRNRFGDTTLRIRDKRTVAGHVETLSGVIAVEAAAGTEPALCATTVFGEVRWAGDVADWSTRSANNPTLLGLFPTDGEASLRLHSEGGRVELRRPGDAAAGA